MTREEPLGRLREPGKEQDRQDCHDRHGERGLVLGKLEGMDGGLHHKFPGHTRQLEGHTDERVVGKPVAFVEDSLVESYDLYQVAVLGNKEAVPATLSKEVAGEEERAGVEGDQTNEVSYSDEEQSQGKGRCPTKVGGNTAEEKDPKKTS